MSEVLKIVCFVNKIFEIRTFQTWNEFDYCNGGRDLVGCTTDLAYNAKGDAFKVTMINPAEMPRNSYYDKVYKCTLVLICV